MFSPQNEPNRYNRRRYGGSRPRPRPGGRRRALRCAPVETDVELVDRLRGGDEGAFGALVDRYHPALLRLARSIAPTPAVAEEAVQDTWLGVVRGIERFEGRAAFRTWLFRILVNRARSAGAREETTASLDAAPSVDPDRFDGNGAWAQPLQPWEDAADDRIDAARWLPALQRALSVMAPRQRQVVLLRDVEGFTNGEVCAILGISAGNQRILLHRGRAFLRGALESRAGKE